MARCPEQVDRGYPQGMRETPDGLTTGKRPTGLNMCKETVAYTDLPCQLSLRQWGLYRLTPASHLSAEFGVSETAHWVATLSLMLHKRIAYFERIASRLAGISGAGRSCGAFIPRQHPVQERSVRELLSIRRGSAFPRFTYVRRRSIILALRTRQPRYGERTRCLK